MLSLSTGFMLVLPWLGQLLGGHNPIIYVFFSCASYPARVSEWVWCQGELSGVRVILSNVRSSDVGVNGGIRVN